MSGGIEWGATIPVNGKKPDWLGESDIVFATYKDYCGEYVATESHYPASRCDWSRVSEFQLLASHPYYLATSKGFTYWPGGDSAPDDWDGGEVLFAGGQNGHKTGVLTGRINFWQHGNIMRQWNIIGYKRKAVPSAAPAPLDFTKPIQTRDGRPVRILCTDGRNKTHPVAGYIGDDTAISMWGIEGSRVKNKQRFDDLINAPDVRVEWYGFNENGSSLAYDARNDLAEGYPWHIRLTWTDGVPKADIFEAGEPE